MISHPEIGPGKTIDMPKIRTFIAAPLTEPVRSRVEEQLNAWREHYPSGVSWTRRENLHFTLAFLGEIEEKRLSTAAEVSRQVALSQSPWLLSLGEIGFFPNPRRPRVIWLGVTQGEANLITLQKTLVQALKKEHFELENRPFVPHLTLGRVRDPEVFPVSEKFTWPDHPPDMQLEKIEVMRSDLHPSGAVHTLQALCPFSP